MKYTNEELELLDSLENENLESVAFDNAALKTMATETLDYLNEKKTNQYQPQKIRLRLHKTKSKRYWYFIPKYYPVIGT